MRNALIVVLVALPFGSSLSAQNRGTKFQFCRDDVARYDAGSAAIDSQHPRYFIEVSELSPRGQSRVILTSRPAPSNPKSRVVCERVNAQVDRNSKIVIRLNRDFLREAKFEGNFSIAGRLEGQGTSRSIEIPGYSVIGKETQVAPVGVAAASTMEGMVQELERHWPDVERRLAVLQSRFDSTVQHQVERARRLAEREASLRTLRTRQATLNTRRDSAARQLAAMPQDSQAVATVLGSIRDSLRVLSEEMEQVQRQLTADSITQRLVARPLFLRQGLGVLRENRAVLLVLDEFTRKENLPLVRAAARAQNRLPSVLISLASTADSIWSRLLKVTVSDTTPSQTLASYDEMVQELRATMRDMTAADDQNGHTRGEIRPILLGAVKDAEINVRQTGARVGEVIVLTFTDSVGVPASDRRAEVRLLVRDFGLTHRISDAILFVNMPGERGAASRIAATKESARLSGSAASLELPVPVRGSPTAGVSFGWVYSPRRDDDYSPIGYPVRGLASWLEPGFGFNASAASVPMKRITLTPDKPPIEEAIGNQVAYMLGGSLSLFDGALVWSGGWTLNGTRAKSYTGLGISFLSATDKARELFKGLNP